MKSFLFFLVLISNNLCASAEEHDIRSRKGALVQRSYFDEEADEKEEKRRKKFRLGATSVKKGGQKTQRAATNSVITTEDKARLSTEPVTYKRKPENDAFQLSSNKRAKLTEQAQTRHPDYLIQ